MEDSSNPVFIIAAARTNMVKYEPRNFRSLSDLLAEPVLQIPAHIHGKIDTVYVTHRYPAPWELAFDREGFLKAAKLPQGEKLRIFEDSRASLGGLDVIDHTVSHLSQKPRSTVLVVGGEVFSPSVVRYLRDANYFDGVDPHVDSTQTAPGRSRRERFDLKERRNVLNKYGGLSGKDKSNGLTPMSANALVADAFFRHYSFSPSDMNELLACISCHLEKYAFLNPRAYQHHKHKENSPTGGMDRITPDKYSLRCKRDRKWPFTLLDLCSISNGAGALVLSNDPAENVHKVRVAACVVKKDIADRSLLDRQNIWEFNTNIEAWRAVKKSLQLDFRRPEPGKPSKMMFELFDVYAFQVALSFIAMGMYDHPRQILSDFKDGYFDPLPNVQPYEAQHSVAPQCGVVLNPSGGSKDGHANGGHAVIKAAECFFRLTGISRGESSFWAPEDLNLAFVHTLSGAGNEAGILALEKA